MASGDPKIKELFDELTRLRREIAKLQRTRSSDPAFAEVRSTLQAREQLKEVLEAKLSSLSGEFATDKRAGKASTSRIAQIFRMTRSFSTSPGSPSGTSRRRPGASRAISCSYSLPEPRRLSPW